MAAIKIVRRKNKQRKDGTAPLALRISKDYKTNYIFLGQYVLERDWDENNGKVKKTHPNSLRLNNFLLKRLTETNDVVFETNDTISSTEMKNKVKRKGHQKSFFQVAAERIKNKYNQNVFSVAKSNLSILYNMEEFLNLNSSEDKDAVIDAIKERRKGRIRQGIKSQDSILDGIKYFNKKKSLYFEDIDTAFIAKYKGFCVAYLGQKSRTITNQLIFMRSVFNVGIKDGVVEAKYYPFAGEKEKIKIGASHKIGLNEYEVEKIQDLEFEKRTSIWHTHNIWLVSFYFAGIRISDILELKWSDFKDGRLFYVMNKNEKPLSLKIPDKAAEILEHYKADRKANNGYVFPFLAHAQLLNPRDLYIKRRNATKLFNKYLKRIAEMCEIDKPLSNHIARHSFGNIAGEKIHPRMLQKLYRHSDLKTTIIYQSNFIHKEADDALDQVINF